MQVLINSSNNQTLEPVERQAMEDYINNALGRFGRQLLRVTVFLDDINGPKGGADQYCKLVGEMPSAGAVTTEETAEDLMLAVTTATDEMARMVQKHWDKVRDLERTPTPEIPIPEVEQSESLNS